MKGSAAQVGGCAVAACCQQILSRCDSSDGGGGGAGGDSAPRSLHDELRSLRDLQVAFREALKLQKNMTDL